MNNHLIFEHQQERKLRQLIRKFFVFNQRKYFIFLLYRNRFDEEKFVECQICKKPFKNGAALNGHMRLHGGFNEVSYIEIFLLE